MPEPSATRTSSPCHSVPRDGCRLDGQADEALALAREHLPTARDFGQPRAFHLAYRAAYVLAYAGRAEAAATVLGRADAIGDEIGAASG